MSRKVIVVGRIRSQLDALQQRADNLDAQLDVSEKDVTSVVSPSPLPVVPLTPYPVTYRATPIVTAAPAQSSGPTPWQIASGISVPLAALVSYNRNQSIGWAVGSALLGPAYLAYVGLEYAGVIQGKKTKKSRKKK